MPLKYHPVVWCLLAIIYFGCSPESNDQSQELGNPQVNFLANEFDIAYIDLANDTTRQYIVDRENDIYFGHPTSVKILENQEEKILTVYPMGGHGKGTTTIRQSDDGGKSWSDRYAGATPLGRVEEVPTIHKVIDSVGKERLIIFSQDEGLTCPRQVQIRRNCTQTRHCCNRFWYQ